MHRNNLQKDLQTVLAKYPKLQLIKVQNRQHLEGEVNIFDKEGIYWDSYSVKIIIPEGYPYAFPLLYEIGGKIPFIADRHINPGGNCCLCTPQEEDIVSRKGMLISSFMEKYVIPFLANQRYYEVKKEWANGEYEHGDKGVLQYYEELFLVEGPYRVLETISLLSEYKGGRNNLCFCGRNKKLKHCHLKQYLVFKSLSSQRVLKDKVLFTSMIV